MSTSSSNYGSSGTHRNSAPANDVIDDQAADDANGLGDFGEASAIQGNSFALIIARSIGALVAVVAITLGIFILLGCRMTLALIISKIGLLGLTAVTGAAIWIVTKAAGGALRPQSIWIVLTRGCS